MTQTEQTIGETQAEIEFIRRIGTYSRQGRKIGRKEMLKRYRTALQSRVNWSAIDGRKILELLDMEIALA